MIPLFRPNLNTEVINRELPKVFNSGMIGCGSKVDEFTDALKGVLGREEVLVTNSCTSSLSLSLRLIEGQLKRDGNWMPFGPARSPILTTSLTCWAANATILNQGWRPEWVDIDPATFCMSLDDLEAKLDRYTRIVMWTSWGGCLPDFNRLEEIREQYAWKYGRSLYIVTDLAHAFDSNRYGASIPEILEHNYFHCLSFGPIKTLTAGNGGALVCPPDFYAEAEERLWYGISRANKCSFRAFSDVVNIGSKWNSDDIAATIGLANLLIIHNVIKQSQENAEYYLKNIKNSRVYLLPEKTYEGSSCWLFTLIVDDRDAFVKHMAENGVEANGIHRPNHTLTCVKEYKTKLPELDRLEGRYCCIPVGCHLKWDDVKHIVKAINSYGR